MKDSKETQPKIKDPAPAIEIDSILKRLEELEGRCTQLEATLRTLLPLKPWQHG